MKLQSRVIGAAALLFLALLALLAPARTDSTPVCGYAACPTVKPGMLNVHLVPHTHDDVGWLKTVDQYFYGTHKEIQNAGVKTIIDSVIQQLLVDPSRRFIWVETAFLWQWWQQQDNQTVRDNVRQLVLSGRLEIIGGGWSMNDEAVTHYQSTIDQFTWGFRKLNDTFGACGRPHIGWQIDPFGHSRETASLMAQMGFDGLFFARVDYQDKEKRMKDKTPEFVWQASDNLGKSSWLFTNLLYNHYSPPKGFCFDILCHDEKIVDDKADNNYNVDKRVSAFLEHARGQAESYTSQNIMMTMGNDFNYMDADVWYTNMDKLIKYVNEHEDSDVHVFYTTPSCYLKAVHDANLTYTTKQDDFFPYASDANSYWTGYFTSRPTLKYFERRGNNLMQVAKQLHALAALPNENSAELDNLRETMGILQHHDAITGTEKQHVAEDYALRLGQAFADGHKTAETALNKLMAKGVDSPAVVMAPCLLLNVSQCETSEKSETFVVSVYNPLARTASHFVRLPVPQSAYKVLDPKGAEVTVQLVPIPAPVLSIPGRDSEATHELVFKAANLPPLGFKAYYVQKLSGKPDVSEPAAGDDRLTIGNKLLKVGLDGKTNLMTSLTTAGGETKLDQSLSFYEAFDGYNYQSSGRASGAYIFRPQKAETNSFRGTKAITFKGALVEEVHQVFSEWVSQVIRVYEGENHVEFEWQVGPIPVEDKKGKEVISRFSTGWPTDGVFYTDSNGRETLRRKRNFRPTWSANISELVSGNYYPITAFIGLKSGESELAVLPDRAQGGSSIRDGELELMVHRRLLHDDAFGVDEALNEQAFGTGLVARGRHIMVLGSGSASSPTVVTQTRQLAQGRMVLAPWLLLAPTQLTPQQWQQNYHTEYSGMLALLPANVHVLTLEPWHGASLLLRLEHFLEHTDDPELSRPATLVLEELFSAFTVVSMQETTLGGNQRLEESARLAWNVKDSQQAGQHAAAAAADTTPGPSNKFAVTLQPMQIRTFVIEVAPRSSGATSHKAQPAPAAHKSHKGILSALKFNVFN